MNTQPATTLTSAVEPLRLHPEVAADRTIRERLEGMNFLRGFLFGAAVSAPFWILAGGAIAMVHALS